MKVIKSLLVTWQHPESLLYYHIGTLNFNGEKYLFEYTYRSKSKRNVLEAMEHGYHLHPAFPDPYREYTAEKLFPAFNRRIPDDSRIGFEQILAEFDLPTDADRMDVLRETRGALSGDPYTFEEPLRLNGDVLSSTFYINGMRHMENLPDDWENYIQPGDPLIAELDEMNIHDPFAVKIMTENEIGLGYIPGIYAQAIHSLLKRDVDLKLTVKEIRPNFSPKWWVRVEFQAIVDREDRNIKEQYNLESFIFREPA